MRSAVGQTTRNPSSLLLYRPHLSRPPLQAAVEDVGGGGGGGGVSNRVRTRRTNQYPDERLQLS